MARIPTPRLPGIVFAPQPPPRAGGLPPLDVAGFVGFAQRGPLDLPVAVEDTAGFAAVFGGTMPLARDARGARVTARLPGSVAAFFANGGRRCHVVRVAGATARAARFGIPGLLALAPGGADARHAAVAASSAGRWGNALRLAARLEATPLPRPDRIAGGELVWTPPLAADAPVPGEVLRLTWPDGTAALFSVTAVRTEQQTSPPEPALHLGGDARRLLLVKAAAPPAPVAARLLTAEGNVPLAIEKITLATGGAGWRLDLHGADALRPAPGDLLRLEAASPGTDLIFPVLRRRPAADGLGAQLEATALLDPVPVPLAGDAPRVERLRLDLRVELPGEPGRVAHLPGLGFDAAHPRFWGDLVLLGSAPGADPARWQAAALSTARDAAEAWRAWCGSAGPTRLAPPPPAALAGLLAPLCDAARSLQHLPLGVSEIAPEHGIAPQEPGADGLDLFDPHRFLDAALVPHLQGQRPGAALRVAAEDRWLRGGIRLRGLHALTFLDEVATVALPDAAHAAWKMTDPPKSPATPPPPPPPDRARFGACGHMAAPPTTPAAPPPDRDLPVLGAVDGRALVALHAAMLRFCHARRDAVALLSLPQGAELPAALAWQSALAAELARDGFGEGFDADGLSYAAAWHPWLRGADDLALPPDGAVAGVIARREGARGAWVAPANEPFAGVLDLDPAFDEEVWATLLGRRINLVRRMPRDFRSPTAHSLSGERSLLHVSVRRLLILLRKLALRRGQELVFESNTERLRETVRLGLEEELTRLFERGAFAGRTPAESFRVLTEPEVNLPAAIERGELLTRILVAPSEPLEFLVVRLSRAEHGALVAGGA